MSTVVGNLSVELGISDDQLRAGLASAMVQAQAAGQRISNSLNQAGSSSSGRAAGGGFGGFGLAISRMADDAQYGFRGIINNMEQLGASAAGSLGMSAEKAMAFGSVLTLTAIAVNNAIPEIEKMLDTRTGFEKLATSAAGFSGSVNTSLASVKALAAEIEKLTQQDKTQGFGAAIQRGLASTIGQSGLKFAAAMADPFNITGIQDIDMSKIGKTFEQQIQENKDAGRQIMRNQIDLSISQPQAARMQEALAAGGGLISAERNKASFETDKTMASMFGDAIKGQAETAKMAVERQLMAEGVQGNQAEMDALTMLGQASRGVKSAFEELARRVPELQLTEKLKAAMEQKSIGQEFDKMVKDELERQSLQAKAAGIERNITDLELRNQRTEIIGGADVFQRNFMAGTSEDPTVKAIEKQTEDLREIMRQIKELN
jgi:hypothetical protein